MVSKKTTVDKIVVLARPWMRFKTKPTSGLAITTITSRRTTVRVNIRCGNGRPDRSVTTTIRMHSDNKAARVVAVKASIA